MWINRGRPAVDYHHSIRRLRRVVLCENPLPERRLGDEPADPAKGPGAMRYAIAGMNRLSLAAAAAALLAVQTASAEETCGLCQQEVVTNSELAVCFLQRYEEFASKANGTVIVDLTECEEQRGIVDVLPTIESIKAEEPDLRFMVMRPQLDCLKAKLEDPSIVLDPSARIRLDSCG
jgi:hypothetical protein